MFAQRRRLLAASARFGFPIQPVYFDGTNDYMSKATDLTGIADGKEGTFSFWFKRDGGGGARRYIFANGEGRIRVAFEATNRLTVEGFSGVPGAGTRVLEVESSNTYNDTNWHHAAISWDLLNNNIHMYIDGVSDVNGTPTRVDTNIDYTDPEWVIGAEEAAKGDRYVGDMAEVWFDDAYFDITNSANLQKFRSSAGKPVDLGTDGSTPTGTQPLVFLANRPGDAASAFATNRGTGGNFTITGTLTNSSTSPSD